MPRFGTRVLGTVTKFALAPLRIDSMKAIISPSSQTQSKRWTVVLSELCLLGAFSMSDLWLEAKGKWHAPEESEFAGPQGNLAGLPSTRSTNVHQVG